MTVYCFSINFKELNCFKQEKADLTAIISKIKSVTNLSEARNEIENIVSEIISIPDRPNLTKLSQEQLECINV